MNSFFELSYYEFSGWWDFFTLSGFLFLIGYFVPPGRKKVSLLCLVLSAAFWALFYARWAGAKTQSDAWLYEKLFTLGGIFAVPWTSQFIYSFLNRSIPRLWLALNHGTAILIAGANFFTLAYVSGYRPLGDIPFYPVAGWLHPWCLAYLAINLFFSLTALVKDLRVSEGLHSQQIKWILFGTALAWASGASTYFGFYGVQFPPVLTPLVSIFIASFIYASIRHGLMDIEVVLRRTVVFGALFISVVGIVGIIQYWLPQVLSSRFHMTLNPFLPTIFSFIASFYLLLFLRSHLIDITDRYLFQKQIDPSSVMAKIISKMSKVQDRNSLPPKLLNEIMDGFRLESGAIYLLDPKDDNLYLAAWSKSKPDLENIELRHPLRCLSFIQQPAGIGIRPPSHQMPDAAINELKRLQYSLAIPLMNERKMIALILLGQRLSGTPFNYDDLDYLVPLSRILSAIYSNSMLREELREAQEKVEEASIDQLTGALMRSAFMEQLDLEFIRARHFNRPFSILMIDLDHFKAKNDTFGHQGGDLILQETAKRIKGSLRSRDLFGRYGGEEFIVFLSGASVHEARDVADRVRLKVEGEPISVLQASANQTVSIGISIYPRDGQTLRELIHKADACLYSAKNRGRNKIISDDILDSEERRSRHG